LLVGSGSTSGNLPDRFIRASIPGTLLIVSVMMIIPGWIIGIPVIIVRIIPAVIGRYHWITTRSPATPGIPERIPPVI
jgi:hypothetical protein